MRQHWSFHGIAALGQVLVISAILLAPGTAMAHCDSEDGPIIPIILESLEGGDITSLLKWISSEDEEEIKSLFVRVRALRRQSDEAKEIADRLFIETFIRVHRAGEGAPYTGIKPAGSILPVFTALDKALESGSVDELAEKVADTVRENIVEQFNHALDLGTHQDESVEAGRDFVEAYVTYVHFVEGLHHYLHTAEVGHNSVPEAGCGH